MPRIRQKNKTATEHGEPTNAQYQRASERRNAVLDATASQALRKGARAASRAESARRESVQRDRIASGEYRPFGMLRQR